MAKKTLLRITAKDGTEVVWNEKKHLCTMNGEPVPSSTRILKRAEDKEFFALNYAKIQAAGELGGHVHYLTELMDMGKKVTEAKHMPKFFKDHPLASERDRVLTRVRLSLRGWENFRNDHLYEQPKEGIEVFTYSTKHKLSGIIDRVALRQSKRWIIPNSGFPVPIFCIELEQPPNLRQWADPPTGVTLF